VGGGETGAAAVIVVVRMRAVGPMFLSLLGGVGVSGTAAVLVVVRMRAVGPLFLSLLGGVRHSCC